MTTCKECVNWILEVDEACYYFGFGACTSDHFKLGYRFKSTDVPDDSVLVEDDEGWGFMTGPNFGCIFGEDKNDLQT